MGHEVVACGIGTVERQRIVDGVGAGVVGVADDGHIGDRVLVQGLGQAVQDGAHVAVEHGRVGGEACIGRHVDLQAVVGGLADLHGRAGSGLFHGSLLLLHVVGPQIPASGTQGCTDGCTAQRVAARMGVADHGTCQGTQTRADGGGTAGLGHGVSTVAVGGTASQKGSGEGTSGEGCKRFVHEGISLVNGWLQRVSACIGYILGSN